LAQLGIAKSPENEWFTWVPGNLIAPAGLSAEAQRNGRLLEAAKKQEFPQQDDLVILVRGCGLAPGTPRLPELPNPHRELRPASLVPAVALENRGSQEFGQKLKLIEGQTLQETAGFGSQGPVSTRG
jgi:hypothetical protein